MKTLILVATLFLSTHAIANDASKREKIRQLATAQGLEQMFQEQIDQSKATTSAMGLDFFDKLTKDSGVEASPDDPKVRAIFARFAEQCAILYSAKEYMDTWISSYGRELSEADIDQILAYYRTPTGKRDVKASQSAMRSFTQAVTKEQLVRMNALTEKLILDLKAIVTK